MISQGTAAATQRIAATRCLLRRAPLAVIIVCIAPLAILWPEFRNLYWFHDDWELLSEMQSSTSVAWLTRRYGENFAPLFKAMWQVAVLGTGGSYTAMILLLWVTHVAVLLLLGRLLRRCGFDWRAQCIALLTLGAAWSNIETLAWASCWISELSILFLLAAWNFA